MKLSLNWLKDYVRLDVDQAKLAQRLTLAGLEIEAVEKVAGDTVFELEVTPNRADCLSILGLAREVSAVFDISLREPKIKNIAKPSRKVPITIADKNDCAVYLGTLIEGVSLGRSSEHIEQRISALGIRPISNLVDITNFCMMESGQPLHVFDFDRLDGGCIQVRRARKGEKIVTLDGIERDLDPSILVIADASRPVAIAGVMGGKDTEVGPQTRNVLLESAYFDPILIRRGARKLGLGSDSSYRFERGVDPAGVVLTSNRAAQLILEIAGGKIVAAGKGGSTGIKKGKAVLLSMDRASSYIGMPVSTAKMKRVFKKLNFETDETEKGLRVIPPSSRPDITAEVDLIEEIARVIGYDQIPEAMPTITENSVAGSSCRRVRNRIREMMLSQGFDETISFSLLNREDLEKAGLNSDRVAMITNPLSLDQEVLQPSTLPGQLNIVKTNINRGIKNLRLFELTKIYKSDGSEQEVLSVSMTGQLRQDWRDLKKRAANIYDLKGAVEQALERAGISGLSFRLSDENIFQQNLGITVSLRNQELGKIGVLRQDVLSKWGIKNAQVLYGQIFIPFDAARSPESTQFYPLSNFPAVMRDVSLAVDQKVTYQDITELVYREAGELLKAVTFSEEYLGDKIPAGQRGLIFSLCYQSASRTLTEDEVNSIHQKLLSQLTETFSVAIR